MRIHSTEELLGTGVPLYMKMKSFSFFDIVEKLLVSRNHSSFLVNSVNVSGKISNREIVRGARHLTISLVEKSQTAEEPPKKTTTINNNKRITKLCKHTFIAIIKHSNKGEYFYSLFLNFVSLY